MAGQSRLFETIVLHDFLPLSLLHSAQIWDSLFVGMERALKAFQRDEDSPRSF